MHVHNVRINMFVFVFECELCVCVLCIIMQFLIGADCASTRSDTEREKISCIRSQQKRLSECQSSEPRKRHKLNPFIEEEEMEAKSE